MVGKAINIETPFGDYGHREQELGDLYSAPKMSEDYSRSSEYVTPDELDATYVVSMLLLLFLVEVLHSVLSFPRSRRKREMRIELILLWRED